MKLSDLTHLLPEDNTKTFELFDTIKAYNVTNSRYVNACDDYAGIPIGKITMFVNRKDEIGTYKCVHIWYVLDSMSEELYDIIRRDGITKKKLTCVERDMKLLEYLAAYSSVLYEKREANRQSSDVDVDEWYVCHMHRVEDTENDRIMPKWKNELFMT